LVSVLAESYRKIEAAIKARRELIAVENNRADERKQSGIPAF